MTLLAKKTASMAFHVKLCQLNFLKKR